MVLKLRLARIGGPGAAKKHAPVYNIVLAQARSARDGKPMEVLGTYDPIPKLPVGAEPGTRKQKDIKIDVSRAKYWLGVGAQPTETVWRLLSMIGLLEPRYLPSGIQTENALKAVRFETHVTTKSLRRLAEVEEVTALTHKQDTKQRIKDRKSEVKLNAALASANQHERRRLESSNVPEWMNKCRTEASQTAEASSGPAATEVKEQP